MAGVRIYNNIRWPDTMGAGTALFIFRKGIPPQWEHPENKHGGKIGFELPMEKATNVWFTIVRTN